MLADGRILSWSDDGSLRLWSSEGAALAVLKGLECPGQGAHVLADGRILFWSSANKSLGVPRARSAFFSAAISTASTARMCSLTVNRRPKLTPYRRPKLTP